MRRSIRWFLLGVLVIDAVAAAFLTGAAQTPTDSPTNAATVADVAQSGDDDAQAIAPSREALLLLGRHLVERSDRLRQREEELDELLRGPEVLRRAGLEDPAETTDDPAAADQGEADPAEEAFARLSRAYENMEPDSAALALIELAAIDKEAVVQLLIGWRARVSGAILDSLTQSNPGLAAELSYEIWKRSGKNGAETAKAGR